MAERHGVEIDYCPKCRGIWLDRGELDKIIEQADPRPNLAKVGAQLGHAHTPQKREAII
jgi:Zn-finger nucleic acid-binding protein